MATTKQKLINFLRWSQKYTKTDMIYMAKGTFWLIVGKVGLLALFFLTMTAFANLIPKETYGSYQYILAVVGLAGQKKI